MKPLKANGRSGTFSHLPSVVLTQQLNFGIKQKENKSNGKMITIAENSRQSHFQLGFANCISLDIL